VILSSLSTQYVIVPVYVVGNASPTGGAVQFAFPTGTGEPTTWYTGSWQSGTTSPFLAQVLVGPAGGVTTFVAGNTYNVYVKVTATPEVPVLYCGQIAVT
jgi:hypothetical protein